MSIVRVSLFFFAFIPWNPVFHTWLKKGWITSAHSLCCGREEEHRTRATEPFIMGCDHGCTLLPWERVFLIYWTRSWEATLSLPSKPRSKPDTWETPSLYFKGFAIQTLLQNSSEKRKKKRLSVHCFQDLQTCEKYNGGLNTERSTWIAYILCFDYHLPHYSVYIITARMGKSH